MAIFSDLKLNPKILNAIQDVGYKQPTPIQLQAIPAALEAEMCWGLPKQGPVKPQVSLCR
jgi:ATP-dependent RNA helicase RhlE